MPWAKVDDKLHAHPKAEEAGCEAMGLYLFAMSHCAAYETDGHVRASFPASKAGKRGDLLAKRLVDVGLWETNGDGGYIVHDWLVYNPSRAETAAIAEKKRLAGKAGGESRSRS